MIHTAQFGVHLMFDGHGASPERLSNLDMLRGLLQDFPRALGMHAICELAWWRSAR